uniref:Uncharacterized protein n=1 Tax=Arundo donax TaxID=35708 RepID=A0A0A8YE46_ARUDO
MYTRLILMCNTFKRFCEFI